MAATAGGGPRGGTASTAGVTPATVLAPAGSIGDITTTGTLAATTAATGRAVTTSPHVVADSWMGWFDSNESAKLINKQHQE